MMYREKSQVSRQKFSIARGEARPEMVERQWRPSQVVEALLAAGLELERFAELPVLYWDQFPHWPEDLKARLPHSYLILATRPRMDAPASA